MIFLLHATKRLCIQLRLRQIGNTTTIRAFDMGTSEQRIPARCPGKVGQLTLSPDGSRLAANMEFGPFEFGVVAKLTEVLCLGLIIV